MTRITVKAVAALLALLSLAVSFVAAKPAFGNRTLVVLDQVSREYEFGQLISSLKGRGHELTVKAATSDLNLVEYEERNYDHLLVLAPKISSFGGPLGVGAVLEFIDKGGNVLVATSSDISEAVRDLAIEFSVDFEEKGTAAIDHFHASADDHTLFATKHVASTPVAPWLPSIAPVLYKGVAHRLTGKNPLVKALLTGSASTYSEEPKGSGFAPNTLVGTAVTLVSGLQARNNARVMFAGSVEMFSDRLFDSPVLVDGRQQYPKSGNEEFVTYITDWVFQEVGVLRVERTKHHRKGETDQHGIYRIKDDMVYELDVSEWHHRAWRSFKTSDLQFEAVMLDPYIRTPLREVANSTSNVVAKYEAHFKLPDNYGVFTFKVDYKRHGYSWLNQNETVQVRPYRHDQYPRFLSAAWPYYVNAFSMIGGFFVFSAVFLYNREPVGKVKAKTT
ncbi:hypothetical protein HK097_004769 [Rhizophlyctis rosea]|uniref:Dolichyl-diphosphooligosaccharide--protein glycosyltransferase subunit WBP1 n=1 Tax=Rhizophlyctis rosea TaxID=64517 RepID=A0AAD5X2P2_9FUNG|nr:hypothetical protein HK097_004769 [Rhizophlyctis rosea]